VAERVTSIDLAISRKAGGGREYDWIDRSGWKGTNVDGRVDYSGRDPAAADMSSD